MSLNPTHLQIAARMQTLLEAWLGEPFDIERMLSDPDESREVLFVCQASNQPELVALAKQFIAAGRPMPVLTQVVAPTRVPTLTQEPEWSRDTSGFGVTDVPFSDSRSGVAPTADRAGWLQRPKWLRRDAAARS